MADRVMIYIDGSNVYHSLKSVFGYTNLDFEAFCKKLARRRQLVRVYYYNAPVDHTKEPERYKEQQTFFNRMRRIPYLEVRLGRLVYRNWPAERAYEKGIDVKMATDMLTHAFQPLRRRGARQRRQRLRRCASGGQGHGASRGGRAVRRLLVIPTPAGRRRQGGKDRQEVLGGLLEIKANGLLKATR